LSKKKVNVEASAKINVEADCMEVIEATLNGDYSIQPVTAVYENARFMPQFSLYFV
jgi:hypothetical protein